MFESIEKTFKDKVKEILRKDYSVNEDTITALNYGNVFNNIKGVQNVIDVINKEDMFSMLQVKEVCELLLTKRK